MPNQPGEGSVSQRANGLWQASLQVDGRRRTVYAKTEREVRRKLADLRKRAALDGGLPDSCTVAELLTRWQQVESARWSPRYQHDVRLFASDVIGPALGRVRLTKLAPDRLQRFYGDLSDRSTERAAHCHRILRRALNVAVRWGLLPASPLARVTPPAHKAKPADVWTVDEVRAFLDVARSDWLGPFYATMLHTGLRPGECLALRWSDWQGDVLKVERALQRIDGRLVEGQPKTATSRRSLTVTPALAEVLKRQRAQQAEWRLAAGPAWSDDAGRMFTGRSGDPLSSSTVDHGLHRLADRTGLSRLGPHKLRHLSASLALANGVPLPVVSRRLGHGSTAITAKIYSHALTGDREAAEAIARAMGG